MTMRPRSEWQKWMDDIAAGDEEALAEYEALCIADHETAFDVLLATGLMVPVGVTQ
jgi:hypothetical protein